MHPTPPTPLHPHPHPPSCPPPVQDNLESQTYETFEKDATKYNTYEEAVYRALLDRWVVQLRSCTH